MNTVINTRFYGPTAQDRFEAFLRDNSELNDRIVYDQTTGVVLVHYTARDLVGTILSHIGGKYPTAFTVYEGSDDERTVRRVYANLPDADKPHVQIIPPYIGFRVSVCVDQYRDDIQAKFWQALYPAEPVSDLARAGRTRDYPEICIKLPKELEATAMAHGDWSQMIVRDDGLYVTEELLRLLRERKRDRYVRSRSQSRDSRSDARAR